MTFADIPNGLTIFLDSNTFIYHFIPEPKYGPACTTLLERVERGEIEAWTSLQVLAEVSHRLMTIEACSEFGWPWDGIAGRLRKHPQHIQQLSHFHDALNHIALLPIHMALIDSCHDLVVAVELGARNGLLTNDALVVAQMFACGVTNLASNDSDFDRVQGITRFAPA